MDKIKTNTIGKTIENKKLTHNAGVASNHRNFIKTGIVKIVQNKTHIIHHNHKEPSIIYHTPKIKDDIQTETRFHFSAENIETI